MRIPSGKTDQLIFFVALDSSDRVTRKTGLSSFTVYRSRNGGTATVYTTPTITELSSSNMPGVYALTIDEDTTIASGSDSEEYCVHITQASMAPVTRVLELYRRDVTTGETITTSSGSVTLTADFRIKKNTALANFPFRMTDSSDHVAPKTGLTVTGQVSKDGAAFGSLTNSVSEISNGWYKVNLAATDLNADTVALKFTATGADQLDITIATQTE
jgi:hypothetical protein